MYAIAEVYETDICMVKIGQEAMVQSPALKKAIPGIVENIGLLVFKNKIVNIDPYSDVNVRVVEVQIRLLESKLLESLTNHQVHVKIKLQ